VLKKSFIILLFLLVLMFFTAACFWTMYGSKSPSTLTTNQSGREKEADLNLPSLLENKLPRLDEPLNILVAGIDKYANPNVPPRPGPWRSDALVLVRIDPQTQRVNCLSIPRDTRAKIPGHGEEKIAHAYAYGKMPLAVAAVEELIGIKVDHFVSVDYTNFARIVDIMGGIEIDVEKEMKGKYYHFLPGRQQMNGEQAYYFVIDRNKPMADIARINSQHQFLYALLEKVREQAGPLDLASMYLEFQKSTDTSLSMSDIIKLAFFARRVSLNKVTMQTLPGRPEYIKGISYWIPNHECLQQLRKEMFDVTGDAS